MYVLFPSMIYCVVQAKEALMDLFRSTNGEGWVRKDKWGTEAPLGDWSGVTVDTNGVVIGLDLNYMNLQGESASINALPLSLSLCISFSLLRLSAAVLSFPVPLYPTLASFDCLYHSSFATFFNPLLALISHPLVASVCLLYPLATF